ncbi:MAG: FtsX-like permease family protein [Candidatus Heimdallarchaeota archaeon]|nr:FtsX-like permease family protein [Candidatus Heimdallarchaeota archaeon]
MSSFIEKLKLYLKMIFLNRRNTIVMFLGLGISLALISESLIFMYSFRYSAFQDFTQEPPTKQFTINVPSFNILEDKTTVLSNFQNITSEAIETAGLEERVVRADWFVKRGTMLYLGNAKKPDEGQIIPDFNLYAIPPDYFSALQEILYNGSLPKKSKDVLVVAKKTTIRSTNLTKLGQFPLYVPVFSLEGVEVVLDIGIPGAGNYVNVTGVVTSEDFNNIRGPLAEDFQAMADYFPDEFIITRYNNFINYIESIGYYPGHAGFTGRVTFNLDKIDAFNIGQEIQLLNRLSRELQREFAREGLDTNIYTELIPLLKDFQKEFIMFQLFGLLFITPIIGMALSLTSYSTNLMKRRQKRQISSMLQRGASRREVIFLLVAQVLEITLMAILVCVIIGYPFAWLMIKSNGFLNFSGTSKFPAINMIIFYSIVGSGFIFSSIVNAKNIWDMSKITTQEAYGEIKESKPLWETLFLDIVFIIVGIALWLIVKTQLKGTAAYSFAYGFGTTAPILLILGSILLATRIYPHFIRLIGKIGWKTPKINIIGLAAKRSLRRKGAVIRSLILISLTFTLIVSSIVTIHSYQDYDSEQAYYDIGADILIRNVDVSDDEVKEQVLGIEGVHSGTYLKATSQITTFGEITYSYLVLGINPEEFAETAYFESEYLRGESPEEFFGGLQSPLDVVMQEDQLNKIGSYTGDELSLIVEKYPQGEVNYTLDVVGIYKFLPRFFMEYPSNVGSVFRFTVIGNYDVVEELAYSSTSISGDMIVKVEAGYEINTVATTIEEELDRTVDSVDELKGTFEGSLRNTMLFGSLNAAFISSLFITISAISLMIIIQAIENEKEVVMLKTLGMSPKQLFSMFTTEALSVVIFGSIIGLATGIFSSQMLIELLTFETVIPPSEMVYPPLQIIIAFGMLFGISLLAAAFTSWMVFRKDTIKSIKQI